MTPKFDEELLDRMRDQDWLEPQDLDLLEAWADSPDSMDRDQVAELLVDFPGLRSKAILLKLSRDEDELVRTEALDSLSTYSGEDVLARLRDAAANDPDSLSRGYGILSLYDVAGDTALPFFRQQLEVETDTNCRIHLLYNLGMCGDRAAVKALIPHLQDTDYHHRCAAVSHLTDLYAIFPEPAIYQAVVALSQTSQPVPVVEWIQGFLHRFPR